MVRTELLSQRTDLCASTKLSGLLTLFRIFFQIQIFSSLFCAKSEDDGVILASMVWGKTDENRVGLLVLCAKTWTEIGRCEFITNGPVPKCLHGWFAFEKK